MPSIAPFDTWPYQSDTLNRLHQSIESGRVPHAMLFVGSPTDTKVLTEYLVKLLLCTGNNAPCGQCSNCLQVDNHPDAVRIDPGESGSVKTAQIEEIQERLSRKSHTGGRLVYTVPGVDTMTLVAANRLLKTLEEPNPSVFALLTATNLRKVLPTILSRCFVYPIQGPDAGLPWEDTTPFRMESDENIAGEPAFAATSKAVVQWAETLIHQRTESLLLADLITDAAEGVGIDTWLWLVSTYFRDLAHVKAGERQYVKFTEHLADLERQSRAVSIHQLYRAAQVVMEARTRLKSNVASNLNLEQMCIRLREVITSV